MKGISSDVVVEMKDFINKSMEMAHFKIENVKKGKKTESCIKLIEGEYSETDGSDINLKIIVESSPQNVVNFMFTAKCMVYANVLNKLFIFCVDCVYIYIVGGMGLILSKKSNIKWDQYNGFSIYQQHLVLYELGNIKYVINL